MNTASHPTSPTVVNPLALGLDTFNDRLLACIALKRITRLEYYAYAAHIPTMTANPANWDSWRLWYKFPRNPLTLQLTAESPDGTQRKQFWFAPWEARKVKGDSHRCCPACPAAHQPRSPRVPGSAAIRRSTLPVGRSGRKMHFS